LARDPDQSSRGQVRAEGSATVEAVNKDVRKATFKTEDSQTVKFTVREQLLQNLQQGKSISIILRKVERSQSHGGVRRRWRQCTPLLIPLHAVADAGASLKRVARVQMVERHSHKDTRL